MLLGGGRAGAGWGYPQQVQKEGRTPLTIEEAHGVGFQSSPCSLQYPLKCPILIVFLNFIEFIGMTSVDKIVQVSTV